MASLYSVVVAHGSQVLMDRWKNRRRMAWLSMLAALVFPLLILVSESPTLGTIAMPFYIFVSAVVGSYMGFATMDDNWRK